MIVKSLNRTQRSLKYVLGTTFKQNVRAQLKPGQEAIFHKNACGLIDHAHVFDADLVSTHKSL